MTSDQQSIQDLIIKSKRAQAIYEKNGSQKLFDLVSQSIAWVVMKPENNEELAKLAVKETGLGNVSDKIQKNYNKTLGLMRDLQDVVTFGLVSDNKKTGISEFLRPKGVIGSIVPSTNPIATPVNNIINAIKTGNSIILAPSPKGAKPLKLLLKKINEQLNRINIPVDLIKMIDLPPSKEKTEHLMKLVDSLVITGSRRNVRLGYSSGTPAIGVGVGNVVSIIDETASLNDAAEKISRSKIFDNATSCSSENSLIVVESVYGELIEKLKKVGGLVLNSPEKEKLIKLHWTHGKITSNILAKDIKSVLSQLDIAVDKNSNVKFLIVPTEDTSCLNPLSGEKMALFLSIFKAKNFDQAAMMVGEIQSKDGLGHSVGLHSNINERAMSLAMQLKTCRIIVNQSHCFATGGFFNNGLPFSLSMGCGSWGGNSIDENLNWRHFVNRVKVSRPIPENKPSLEDIFSEYWSVYGK